MDHQVPRSVLAERARAMSVRLRQIREELFGTDDAAVSALAERLGVSARSWAHYESGVMLPGEIVLRFIEITAVDPHWLLHGRGPQFRWLASPTRFPPGPRGS